MTDITQIKEWRAPTAITPVYERLLNAMGTEEFGSTVRDSVFSFTAGARRLYLFEATGREDSSLHYFSCEPGVAELFPAYNSHYLRLDPIALAYRAAPSVHGTSRRTGCAASSTMMPASSNAFRSSSAASERGVE